MTDTNGEEGRFRDVLHSPIRQRLNRLSSEYRRRFSSFDENDPETSEVSIPSESVLPKEVGCVVCLGFLSCGKILSRVQYDGILTKQRAHLLSFSYIEYLSLSKEESRMCYWYRTLH